MQTPEEAVKERYQNCMAFNQLTNYIRQLISSGMLIPKDIIDALELAEDMEKRHHFSRILTKDLHEG